MIFSMLIVRDILVKFVCVNQVSAGRRRPHPFHVRCRPRPRTSYGGLTLVKLAIDMNVRVLSAAVYMVAFLNLRPKWRFDDQKILFKNTTTSTCIFQPNMKKAI